MTDFSEALDKTTKKAPNGWSPRVEYDESGGEGITPARAVGDSPPSHQEVLGEFGLDPLEWEVISLRRSKWQVWGGEWLEAYRASFRPRSANSQELVQADIEDLLQSVRDWRPEAYKKEIQRANRGSGVFFVGLADWQIGSGSDGGSASASERILQGLQSALYRLEQLRASGYKIKSVALVGLGDLVDQCQGFYSDQLFTSDLNVREQRRLTWDLALAAVKQFSAVADEVLLTGVSGNHSETRIDGKRVTDVSDSDDLLMLDALRRIVAEAPALDNVRVEDPQHPLFLSADLAGVKVSATHGHIFGSQRGAVNKAREWWAGQALGMTDAADSQILVTGHFHSLAVADFSEEGRTFIQSPAMMSSRWYRDATRLSARLGMLTMLVGESLGDSYGFTELEVVS